MTTGSTAARRVAAAAVTAATVVALAAGCATDPAGTATTAVAVPPPGGPVPTATWAPSAEPTPEPTATPGRSRPVNQVSIDGQQVARSTAAGNAAIRFMQAFARPDLSEAAWWARLGPLLTTSGQEAAWGTDPALIPVREVTGPAVVLPGAEKDARTVDVPTDIGDYTLFLLWDRPTSRWLVATYQPPPDVK